MKKLVLLLMGGMFTAENAKSQKVNFGVTIGNTISTYKIEVDPVSVTSKPRVGYTLGVLADIGVSRKLSIQPAFNFVQKGGVIKEQGGKQKLITNYFEVPLNLTYKIPSRNGSFFIGAGPSVSLGLYGKDEWEFGNESGSEDVKFGSGSNKHFKSFEAGANFNTGFIGGDGFMMAVSYNTSLSNSANEEDAMGAKFNNRYFALRIGYMLRNITD